MSESKPKAKIGRPSKGDDALTVAERSRRYRKRRANQAIDVQSALSQDRDILLDLLHTMMNANQSAKGLPRLLANALEEQPDATALVRLALFKHYPPPVHQAAKLAHIRRIEDEVRESRLDDDT